MLLRYDSKIIESDVEHIFKKCLLVERLTQTHINKQYFKLRKNIFVLISSLTFKNISGIYNDF